jgi:hypothetical protein
MRCPERWSGFRRNWSRQNEVTLNPEKTTNVPEGHKLIKEG